ncbi:hypothetical protein [Limnoglobus roseus]|uniref:DUF3352 domain-containing protein n=1 Tax=Limnoglobus roseus TaxID=2598579 RepID=A0A5C1A6M8_9BACT|nr:hypothetical protein [Limnoglobus roseus]QEL14035.1 hypothetical protein PX52LOC_00897 [Limnoglobus roseus]
MRFVRKLFAAAALGLALTAAPAGAAEVEKLIPAEAESYFQVNVKQILDSDLFKKYALANVKQALEGNDAQKMFKALGLDPLKDVDTLTGGFWGDNPQEMKALVVVHGTFDPEKLFEAAEAAAKKDGDKVAIVKEGEYTLVKITGGNRPEPFFVSVADKKTLVGGTDKKLVAVAMKGSESGTKSGLKKELAELVAKMDGKASLFGVGVTNGKVGDLPPIPGIDDPEKLKKQIEQMQSSSLTLKVTGDVALEIQLSMKSEDAATDFGTTIDDLLGKAKALLPLVGGQAPQMKPIITDVTKSLKSKVDKKEIVIGVKLTGGAIGKAAGSDD